MAQLTIPEVQAIQTSLALVRSKRMRVMEAMRELLSTITVSRGYYLDVMEVSYDVKSWRDKSAPQTPVIYIIDDTTQIVRHAGLVREYRFSLRIFGVLRDKTIVEFEEFIADVEQCIYDNNTLFGQANKVEVPQVTTDNQLFSQLDGTHLFEFLVEVEYTRSARTSG